MSETYYITRSPDNSANAYLDDPRTFPGFDATTPVIIVDELPAGNGTLKFTPGGELYLESPQNPLAYEFLMGLMEGYIND